VLQGLNLDAAASIARAVTIPVIASGGFAGMADVQRLLEPRYKMLEERSPAARLYDGRIDSREALALIAANSKSSHG
jgi:phosphoribosylformimino-5-aminoimidazole carboxamide ribotide isomerase